MREDIKKEQERLGHRYKNTTYGKRENILSYPYSFWWKCQ
jgi:hypothetical protein